MSFDFRKEDSGDERAFLVIAPLTSIGGSGARLKPLQRRIHPGFFLSFLPNLTEKVDLLGIGGVYIDNCVYCGVYFADQNNASPLSISLNGSWLVRAVVVEKG